MIKIKFVLLLILMAISSYGIAQDTIAPTKKELKNIAKAEKIENGEMLISPLIVPAYTPELGGLLAVGGIMSFKTNKADDKIQRSSFPLTLGYTTTGAIVFQSKLATFWNEDKMRIFGDFWYKDMPDNYWGVGYENGYTTPVSDSTTAYDRLWWWINPRFLFRVKESLYVGVNIDYNYTQGSNPSYGVENDPYYMEYNDKPLNSGLGVIVQYDSRDIPINAWEGFYTNVDYTYYTPSLGGDNDYSILNVDVRNFINTGREGSTFAWQAKGRFGFGDIPYGEMAQLGTPFDLRGYVWGKYRDESMVFIIAEYRHQFSNPDGSLKKSGLVAWVAGGSVFGVDNTRADNNKVLPNFGCGYRFELQPRMNMRIDLGFGRETMGVYFNFNEAF